MDKKESYEWPNVQENRKARIDVNTGVTLMAAAETLKEIQKTKEVIKLFKMKHLFFTDRCSTFTEINPPTWIIHRDNHWWWQEHVLTLDIGKSIDSSFNRITRVK